MKLNTNKCQSVPNLVALECQLSKHIFNAIKVSTLIMLNKVIQMKTGIRNTFINTAISLVSHSECLKTVVVSRQSNMWHKSVT